MRMRDIMKITETSAEDGSVDAYLSLVEALSYRPITRSVWRTIRDEGLDEETGCTLPGQWSVAILPISPEDREGLIGMTDAALEKFNRFDISLKERHKLKLIDLIDYDRGIVQIVRAT